FFQAEDGIRDRNVTGVQTCALPIFLSSNFGTETSEIQRPLAATVTAAPASSKAARGRWISEVSVPKLELRIRILRPFRGVVMAEIGRASCRESVQIWDLIDGIMNKE